MNAWILANKRFPNLAIVTEFSTLPERKDKVWMNTSACENVNGEGGEEEGTSANSKQQLSKQCK